MRTSATIRLLTAVCTALLGSVMGSVSLPAQAALTAAPTPGPAPALTQPAPDDKSGQAIFAAVKPSIVQIRTLVKGSQSQTSIGSGFYVSADGLIITNFHVVSDYALEPDTYELKFAAPNGEAGDLKLLAVDVLHDLALVQRQGSNLPWLRFNHAPIGKGTLGYALGNPGDLGLTIVGGTYNGLRDHSLYPFIHFTGAINAGMSGGPVVTEAQQVFGINEARMIDDQLIAFLVPSHFAEELLNRWRARPVAPASFEKEVTSQLNQHSDNLLSRLSRSPMPTQQVGHYLIPDQLDPYMRCWGGVDRDPKKFYQTDSYFCEGSSSVFVDDETEAGSAVFVNQIIHSSKLDPLRFSQLLADQFSPAQGDHGDAKRFSPYACQASTVQLRGTPARAAMCLRQYKLFPELYDFTLKLVTLKEGHRALLSQLRLTGVKYRPGLAFIRQYMNAIQWKD